MRARRAKRAVVQGPGQVEIAVAPRERERDVYDLVVAMRYDLAWFTPWRFADLQRAQLWFPAQCCHIDPQVTVGHPAAARKYGRAAVDLVGETTRVGCAGTETSPRSGSNRATGLRYAAQIVA